MVELGHFVIADDSFELIITQTQTRREMFMIEFMGDGCR